MIRLLSHSPVISDHVMGRGGIPVELVSNQSFTKDPRGLGGRIQMRPKKKLCRIKDKLTMPLGTDIVQS